MRVQEQRQPKKLRKLRKFAFGQRLAEKEKGRHLSRGSFFPLFLIRSAAFAPPPSRAFASFASRSATTSSMAFARAWNSGDPVEMSDGRTVKAAWYGLAIGGFGRARRLSLSDDDDDAVRRKSCEQGMFQPGYE